MSWIETFLDAFRERWCLFLSLFLQTAASVPLVDFSLCSLPAVVKEDRAGTALIWLMVVGEIRAGAIPPRCAATQRSVKLWCMCFVTECVQREMRGLLGRWSECMASGSPVGAGLFVCFLTVWVYAWHQDTRVLRYHSAQLISLGLEVTLEQALNALGEKSWGSSAPWFMPKLFLMLFDCFRYGQEYITDTPCCHIASMEAARPAVQQSHGSVCLSLSLYLLSWT